MCEQVPAGPAGPGSPRGPGRPFGPFRPGGPGIPTPVVLYRTIYLL